MARLVDACSIEDVESEDVIRFDHDGRVFAIYRSLAGRYFATDGICTHEHASLADGLVIDDVIECPKHNGRFNYETGQAVRLPPCVALQTYPVRVVGDRVCLELP